MALTLESAARLLDRHGLLREIIRGDVWTLDPHDIKGFDEPFSAITYDTRKVEPGTFLCCKGRFKAEYLQGIDERGLAAYVSENDFSDATQAPGLIVDDVRKAMALLSAEFYGRPQDQLKVVGITGTKGKTTTAYLTQAMLNGCSGGKCALFSSVDNCLDGHTYVESDLTTPESMDAFRMMREPLITAWNISSWRSPRRPTRWTACSVSHSTWPRSSTSARTISARSSIRRSRIISTASVKSSRTAVPRIGADCARADLIRQDARHASVPVTTFALGGDSMADVMAAPANDDHSRFSIVIDGTSIGELSLTLDGDFNYANAAAAVAIARAAGFDFGSAQAKDALREMEPVRIAGRMEHFKDTRSNTIAIVDYAHNYASVTALLDYVDQRYGSEKPEITLITGSAGNKAYDRRAEIVHAAQDRIDHLVLTFEDTDDEPVEQVCADMNDSVTNRSLT